MRLPVMLLTKNIDEINAGAYERMRTMSYNFSEGFRNWNAKWIWEACEEQNTWVCFRKKVSIDNAPQSAVAYISAESRYYLYINGKNAVFEGSLKRGYNLDDGFYDEVEIAPYLSEGENIIAVIAPYWGVRPDNFCTSSAGKAGFVFECCINGVVIATDKSWRVLRHPAYLDDSGKLDGISENQPGFRIPEFNVYFDGRLDIGDFTALDYDDSAWENSTEVGIPPCAPWGRLYKRCIPLWKDYGLRDYRNSDKYIGYRTKEAQVLELCCEYNCQLTPYIELESEQEGLKINIYSDAHHEHTGAYCTVKCNYITRRGAQSFESLAWFNGQSVFYEIPAGVTIKALKYRETGYDTEFVGHFKCNDDFFNELWIKSRRTLYITMRDTFMDCPDRERAQWWGDATNEMMMMPYCMDEKSYALYEKGWYTKAGTVDSYKDSVLRTVVPAPRTVKFELPAQELAGICGIWEYYMFSGNKQILIDMYPYIRDYLMLWSFDDEGRLVHREGSWDWYDWGEEIDYVPLEYAWYYRSLETLINICKEIGKESELAEQEHRRELIRLNFDMFYCEGNGFKFANEIADDRCTAVAVLGELNIKGRETFMANKLNTVENCSPYMEKYALDAMVKLCPMEDVQARIRRRYTPMVYGSEAYSTLWEHFGLVNGTKNHAWTGGPLITMSKHMAGISPTKPGYAEYRVEPRLGELKFVDCSVYTIAGDITLNCSKGNDELKLELTTELEGLGTVVLPSEFTNDIFELNIPAECNFKLTDGKPNIEISKGKWSIDAKIASGGITLINMGKVD